MFCDQVSLMMQYLYSEVMPVHTMFRTHVYRHVHTVDKVVCHVIVIVTPLITPHVLVRRSVPLKFKITLFKLLVISACISYIQNAERTG